MSDTDIKNLIVESATMHFSKYGFHKTTMDEIAKHIHKAKGVLYYYFKNKEELFNEVLKHELGLIKEKLLKIVHSNNDASIVIKDYILTRFKLLNKAVNYHETLKADFFEKYHFVKDVRVDFNNFERAQLFIIIEKGKNEGYINIKNINSIVDIAMMIMTSIEIPLFLQDKYDEYKSSMNELVFMITNSLRSLK